MLAMGLTTLVSGAAMPSFSSDMGKIYDLKEQVAAKLKANVSELTDVDVIPHHGRDCSTKLREGLGKASGLAVIVDVTQGENEKPTERAHIGLRLNHTLSITLWAIPIHLKFQPSDDLVTIDGESIVEIDDNENIGVDADAVAPLTAGPRHPDNVLEAVLSYLHNLDPAASDSEQSECGNSGEIRVIRWGMINAEPPFLVFEIQASITTQL